LHSIKLTMLGIQGNGFTIYPLSDCQYCRFNSNAGGVAVCLDSFTARYFLETSLHCRITSARCKKLSLAPYIIGNMGDCSCQRQLGRLGDYSHQWCAAWRSTTVAVGSKRVSSRCLNYDDEDCYCYYYYYKKCIAPLAGNSYRLVDSESY